MAVDYDPVKAHQYYEQHKKLKGRRGKHSTKGFSTRQKEQWAYAKDQLSQEHKDINTGITEESKARRKELSEQAKNMISQLRGRLKGMSKQEKAKWKEKISNMISDIREELKSSKETLTEETKEKRGQEKEDYGTRKDEAYNKIKKGAK